MNFGMTSFLFLVLLRLRFPFEKGRLSAIKVQLELEFLTRRVSAESAPTFSQKSFSTIFGGHLEFLRKMQNAFISVTVQDRSILKKFLTCSVYSERSGTFCPKNAFIWESVRDRRNFRPTGNTQSDLPLFAYTQSHLPLLVRNCFTSIFGGHLEFQYKKQNRQSSGNFSRKHFPAFVEFLV